MALHEHRWMMDFMGGRPPVGPRSLQNIERALASLDDAADTRDARFEYGLACLLDGVAARLPAR